MIIIFTFFIFRVASASENCLLFKSSEEHSSCVFCKSGFYNSALDGAESFPKENCILKNQGTLNGTRTVFVTSPKYFDNEKIGNLSRKYSVYKNLPEAFFKEDIVSSSIIESKIAIKLMIGYHFVTSEAVIAQGNAGGFFVRNKLEVEISPLYCSEAPAEMSELCHIDNEFATVYLKSKRFFLFVSKKLFIRNLIINGADLQLEENGDSCCNLTRVCCPASINPNCSTKAEASVSPDIENFVGLFTLEPIIDDADAPVPEISLANIIFESLDYAGSIDYQLSQTRPSTFILIYGFEGMVTAQNCTFNKIFFHGGVLTRTSVIRAVYQPILKALNLSKITAPSSRLFFQECVFNNYNFQNTSILSSLGSEIWEMTSLFSLVNFKGIFTLKNNKFLNSNLNNDGLLLLINRYQIPSAGEIRIIENLLVNNSFSFIISATDSSSRLGLIATLEQNSFWHNNLARFAELGHIKNFTLKGNFSPPFKLPRASFIRASFSIMFLADCYFSDQLVDLPYSLIQITSYYEISTDTVFTLSKRTKGAFFSNETTSLKNFAIKNSSFLLFSSLNLNYLFSLENCVFETLLLGKYETTPFIVLLSEGPFSMKNVTFSKVIIKWKLIYFVKYINASFDQLFLNDINIYNTYILFFQSFTECNLVEHQITLTSVAASNIIFFSKEENSGAKYAISILCSISEYGKGSYVKMEDIVFANISYDRHAFSNILLSLGISASRILNFRCFNISNAIVLFTDSKFAAGDLTIDNIIFLNRDGRAIIRFLDCGQFSFSKVDMKNTNLFSRRTLDSSRALGLNFVQNVVLKNITIEVFLESGSVIFTQPYKLSSILIENINVKTLPGSKASILTVITVNKDRELKFPWGDHQLMEARLLNGSYKIGIINSSFSCAYESAVVMLVQSEVIFRDCTFKDIAGNEGGLIKITQESKALFYNIVVINCYSDSRGGCFFVEDSIVILINANIKNSTSMLTGGCINSLNSEIKAVNVTVFNSSSTKGGVILIDKSRLLISKTNFTKAFASSYGGHLVSKESTLFVFKSYFSDGYAPNYGGSFFLEATDFFIIASEFTSCKTKQGVLFSNQGLNEASSVLENVIFIENFVYNSGALLYFRDNNVRMNLSNIINNSAQDGYLINFFGSSIKPNLHFEYLRISGNQVKESLLLANEAEIFLHFCYVHSNKASNGKKLFDLTNSLFELGQSFVSQSSKNEHESLFFLVGAKSSIISLASCLINMSSVISFLTCSYCRKIEAAKMLFHHGWGRQGGVFSFHRSSFFGRTIIAKNNTAVEGGVIYSSGSNLTFDSSSFLGNFARVSGSDIFAMENEMLSSVVNVSNSIFTQIQGVSVNATRVLIYFNFTAFSWANSGLSSQVLYALSCPVIFLLRDYFGFFTNVTVLQIYNKNPVVSNISIIACYFTNSKNLNGNGAFIGAYGLNSIGLINSSFLFGTASRGGAIYIGCPTLMGCPVELRTCSFKNNTAVDAGGAISSESLGLSCIDCEFISNQAPVGEKINYFPTKLLFFELSNKSFESTEEVRSDIYNHFKYGTASSFIKLLNKTIKLKPGYPFSFGFAILDEASNVQFDENSILAKINVHPQRDSDEIKLKSSYAFKDNLAKVLNGIGLFFNLTLAGIPNSNITGIVTYSNKKYKISATLNIEVLNCSVGDSYQDQKCQKCPENYYSLDENPQEKNSLCRKCPDNADCPGGNIIIPRINSWRKDFASPLIFSCKMKDGCQHQDISLFQTAAPYQFLCKKGYEGNLCQACNKGFGLVNNSCVECDSSKFVFVTVLLSGFIIYLIFLHIQERTSLDQSNSDSVPVIKILVNHISIFIILTTLKINWSDLFIQFLNISSLYFSTSPSTIYSFDCFFDWGKEESLFFTIIMAGFSPIVLSVLAFIKNIIIQAIRILLKREERAKAELFLLLKAHLNRNWLSLEFFKYLSILFMNIYPPLLINMFKAFGCKTLDLSSEKYLTQLPWLTCETYFHKKIRVISLFFIFLWGLLFPMTLLVITRRAVRSKITTMLFLESSKNPNNKKITFNKFIETKIKQNKTIVVNYLVNGFKPQFYWWEISVFSRKLLFFCLASFSEEMDPASISGLSILLLTCYMLLTLTLKPYRNLSLNFFEAFSLLVSITSIIMGLILSLDDLNISSFIKMLTTFLLALINLLFFILWASLFFQVVLKTFLKKISKELSRVFPNLKAK